MMQSERLWRTDCVRRSLGSDTTVQAGLERLASDARADEVIVLTETYEHSDRIDSYRRVARIAAKILAPTGEAYAG